MGLSKETFLRQSKNLELNFYSAQKILYLVGPQGTFSYPLHTELTYSKANRKLWLKTVGKKTQERSFLKMYQILLNQAALGILLGYRKQLNIVGIGYQVIIEKKGLNSFMVFKLGCSHQLYIKIPKYAYVTCPKPRVLLLKGINFQRINNLAATIRRLKLPSAYKEKGIYYKGTTVSLKQGKKT